MIGSGIGLSRAFWITTNAVLKTPVPKHTMPNFGCSVINLTPISTQKEEKMS